MCQYVFPDMSRDFLYLCISDILWQRGCTYTRPDEEIYYDEVYVENAKTHKPWMGVLNDGYHDGMESDKYTLSWAPEINTHTPDVTDRKKEKS